MAFDRESHNHYPARISHGHSFKTFPASVLVQVSVCRASAHTPPLALLTAPPLANVNAPDPLARIQPAALTGVETG